MADIRDGKYDVTLDFKNGRQSLPDPDLHNDGVYDAASKVSGVREYLGSGTTDEQIKDPDYPGALPADSLTNQHDVAFDSVAPYKHREFPEASPKVSGGGSSPVPLT